jgi:hypothetical protein
MIESAFEKLAEAANVKLSPPDVRAIS